MSEMAQQISWLMPLLLLPGIALLINAASTRYSAFQSEIHHLLAASALLSTRSTTHLRTRALLFRTALVALHLSACIFAVTSILGVALEVSHNSPYLLLVVCTGSGIVFLIVGLLELSREARLSHEVIVDDIKLIAHHETAA